MKKYEAVFILDIRKAEDDGLAFSNEFAELIGKLSGKMVTTEAMGRLQFSYEIKKRKAGIYFDFVFEAPEAAIIDIKNRYHLDERVLRNMIIICDRPEKVCGKVKDLKEITPAPAAAPAAASAE